MKLTRRVLALVLVLVLCAGSAMARQSVELGMYVDGKNANKVHLRAQPSLTAQSLGLLYTGTQVQPISGWGTGWLYVQLGTEKGYISETYLSDTQPASKAQSAVVTNPNSTWVNLRQGASRQAQSIGRLYNGDVVSVLGELSSGWSYIQCGDQVGFMVSTFLAASNTSGGSTQSAIANPNLAVIGYAPNGDRIIRLKAPDNGQELYFVSQQDKPTVYWDDVNFDGVRDLVVAVAQGASNQFCLFFVRSGASYVSVRMNGMENGVCNYQLYPKQRLVLSYANNGSAGACHEYALLRWNGSNLNVIRKAVSDTLVTNTTQNGLMVQTTDPNQIKITVCDYNGASMVRKLFETTVFLSNSSNALTKEENTLWQGLK